MQYGAWFLLLFWVDRWLGTKTGGNQTILCAICIFSLWFSVIYELYVQILWFFSALLADRNAILFAVSGRYEQKRSPADVFLSTGLGFSLYLFLEVANYLSTLKSTLPELGPMSTSIIRFFLSLFSRWSFIYLPFNQP